MPAYEIAVPASVARRPREEPRDWSVAADRRDVPLTPALALVVKFLNAFAAMTPVKNETCVLPVNNDLGEKRSQGRVCRHFGLPIGMPFLNVSTRGDG